MRCSFWQIPAMIFHQKQKIYWQKEWALDVVTQIAVN